MRHAVVCLRCGLVYCTENDETCEYCNGSLYHTSIGSELYRKRRKEMIHLSFKRICVIIQDAREP